MASISVQTFDGDGALDANWTAIYGTAERVSGKAETTTASQQNEIKYSGTNLDSDDHYVQATIGGKSLSNDGYICARMASGTTRTYYNLEYQESASRSWKTNKRVSGSITTLDSYTHSVGGTLVAKLEVDGSSAAVYIAGNLIDGFDLGGDTAITGNVNCGFGAYSNNGGRIDDWSAADLAGGGSTTLTAEQGAVAITGQVARLQWHHSLKAEQGAVAISGQDATLTYTPAATVYTLTAEQGSIAITGQAARLNWHQAIKAEQGAVAITGQVARLQWHHNLKAEQASVAITGQDAALKYTGVYTLTADQAGVAITGQAARLQYNRTLKAKISEITGSQLSLTSCCTDPDDDQDITGWSAGYSAILDSVAGGETGNCLSITENGVANPYAVTTLALTPGKIYKVTYSYKAGTGNVIRAYVVSTLTATNGNMTATADWKTDTFYLCAWVSNPSLVLMNLTSAGSGQTVYFDNVSVNEVTDRNWFVSANLLWHQTIKAEQGAAAITGQAARLQWTHTLKAEQASVAITGQASGTLWNRLLKAEAAALAVTGNDIDFYASRLLRAEQAAVAISGQSVDLRYSGAVVGTPAERTFKVPAESRAMIIKAENRTIIVPAEARHVDV